MPLGIVAEQVRVLLEGGAAAGRVDDDGIELERLEHLDVLASQCPRRLALADMDVQRAAAALLARGVHIAAVPREHAHAGLVRLAQELLHHAAGDEPDAVSAGAACP